jgi:metal-responsive CopG/Arc/MetJ family transcriptional regulator
MSVRINMVLSDKLNQEIEKIIEADSDTTRSEIFRKAIELYLAARNGAAHGLKIGLVERDTDKLRTEIIGL